MSLKHFLLVRLGRFVSLPILRQVRRFTADCEYPERVQTEALLRILGRQRDTGFGHDHGFPHIATVADFRRQVPVAPYEQIAPYIEKVKNGDTRALLADRHVRMFALTSGTTASRKFIPVTDEYLRLYRRGWNIWGYRNYRDHRPRNLAMRPILQLGGDPEEFRTSAGIPCGNLSGYTARAQKRMIRKLFAVPHETGSIKDAKARYYVALRFTIGRNVSQFMAANPSTLVAIGRTLDAEKEHLLRDLRDGTLRADLDIPSDIRLSLASRLRPDPRRATELSTIAEKLGRLYPRDVWPPEWTLINTWTGGSMGPYLRQLPQYYGEPPIRDMGLIASEGRMTIPFADFLPSGVLDIWSHYFEFIPEAEVDSPQPTVLGAHELREGASYYLILTTEYGLYRYHISDLVRVAGFLGRTPVVEFLGKGHRFSNLTGEKLSEHHVTQAMDATMKRVAHPITAYTLAPVWDEVRPYYGLFIEEGDATDETGLRLLLAEFDRELGVQNIEYAAKRESNRLGPVRAEVIAAGAWAAWDRERLAKTGGSPEQYKHPCLIGEITFKDTMRVRREITTNG